MNKNFLAITACNYPCKRPDIRIGYFNTSKGGNIYLNFKNSLLKYAGNKRRHKFVITRINVN